MCKICAIFRQKWYNTPSWYESLGTYVYRSQRENGWSWQFDTIIYFCWKASFIIQLSLYSCHQFIWTISFKGMKCNRWVQVLKQLTCRETQWSLQNVWSCLNFCSFLFKLKSNKLDKASLEFLLIYICTACTSCCFKGNIAPNI